MRVPRVPGIPGVRIPELVPLLGRRAEARPALTGRIDDPGARGLDEARQVIVSAAAPFAPTSFARARLLRQLHACGLLSADETAQAEILLGVAR